ncbi:MAG: O-acetylhomoserine aminocarboxypropyltransferase/cysteine synthase [Oscillospiraceae bacterium]|nr:O-acetylhomoserine aminocarboxypropyltransferase/cysteine synthase [Oscillospiraceae bacterium]
MEKQKYQFETLQVQVGHERPDPATDAHEIPIYLTNAYVFPDSESAAARFALTEPGNIYTRIMNPTSDAFERRAAALEGGVAALSMASGMAAVAYAVQNIARAGDHIVSDKRVYGGTFNLFSHTLPQQGLETTFVDGGDPASFEAAIRPNTKALFFETLGNPNSTVPDIEALADIAHRHGIPLIADNTFATPYLLRPIEYGADIVLHSATKFLGGHGTVTGGVVVDSGGFDWANGKFPGLSEPNESYHGVVFTEAAGPAAYIAKMRTTLLRDTGACISPFNSFLLLQGMDTLSLRMERHTQNALRVVEYLAAHPGVERVNHPALPGHPDHALYQKYFSRGAGSIFTFEIKGGADAARRFCEGLELFAMVANVADVKSLVVHPASTTHAQLSEEDRLDCGILPGTVRLSIGIEHIGDILADLELGFKAV